MDHFKNALFLAASTRLAPSFRYKNVGKSCIFEFLRNDARHDWINLKTEDNLLETKISLFLLTFITFFTGRCQQSCRRGYCRHCQSSLKPPIFVSNGSDSVINLWIRFIKNVGYGSENPNTQVVRNIYFLNNKKKIKYFQ